MMFNRLWPLAAFAVLAGASRGFVPQVPVVATGFCLLVALCWRRQSSAVPAIEGATAWSSGSTAAPRSARRSCCGSRACGAIGNGPPALGAR